MLVNLKDIKPNPQRDFTVDPLDVEKVEELRISIKEDGFWGGVVCRKNDDGEIEAAAGWHRIKAAMRAGIDRVDIYVARDMDDAGLIRVYARENATQRGNTGTAQAGTIAASLRLLAKAVMSGTGVTSRGITGRVLETARGQITTEKGIGAELILKLLGGVPGINENSIRLQLNTLRSSGDYKRIVGEVSDEIERENREAVKALERAEKERAAADQAAAEARQARLDAEKRAKAARDEAEKRRAKEAQLRAEANAKLAAKRAEEANAAADTLGKSAVGVARATTQANANNTKLDAIFDYEGTAAHLKTTQHIEAFRKAVTTERTARYLPVKKQAALAAEIVRLSKKPGVELNSRFISDHIASMVHGLIVSDQKAGKEAKDRELKENWEKMARELQHRASRQLYGAVSIFVELAKHEKARPSGVTLFVTNEFRDAVKATREALSKIKT